MKVKCIDNTNKNLLPNTQKKYHLSTSFFVEVGGTYTVYSISFWRGVTEYLVCLHNKLPLWCPAELFEIVDDLLPVEWYCCFRMNVFEEPPITILGYREMIDDPNHHYLITDTDPEALELFFKSKKEIDEYEALSKYREKKT